MALIIVADNNDALRQVVQQEFQKEGHQVLVANTGREILNLAERYCPDLVLLNPTQLDGSRVYQQIKAMPNLSKTQVLFFRIHVQLEEEPNRLNPHAEPQLPESSPLKELTVRANSLLHRPRQEHSPAVTDHLVVGKLILHAHNLTVESNGRISSLTPTEFDLLRYLMLHADQVCSSASLLQNVWGYPPDARSTDLVRAHIRNLRQKIEEDPTQPVYLCTVRHYGYMLCSKAPQRKERRNKETTPASDRRILGRTPAPRAAGVSG